MRVCVKFDGFHRRIITHTRFSFYKQLSCLALRLKIADKIINCEATTEAQMPETLQSKNKQLISNFEAEIAVEPKQLEAQPENVVAYRKKRVHICLVLHNYFFQGNGSPEWYTHRHRRIETK